MYRELAHGSIGLFFQEVGGSVVKSEPMNSHSIRLEGESPRLNHSIAAQCLHEIVDLKHSFLLIWEFPKSLLNMELSYKCNNSAECWWQLALVLFWSNPQRLCRLDYESPNLINGEACVLHNFRNCGCDGDRRCKRVPNGWRAPERSHGTLRV